MNKPYSDELKSYVRNIVREELQGSTKKDSKVYAGSLFMIEGHKEKWLLARDWNAVKVYSLDNGDGFTDREIMYTQDINKFYVLRSELRKFIGAPIKLLIEQDFE